MKLVIFLIGVGLLGALYTINRISRRLLVISDEQEHTLTTLFWSFVVVSAVLAFLLPSEWFDVYMLVGLAPATWFVSAMLWYATNKPEPVVEVAPPPVVEPPPPPAPIVSPYEDFPELPNKLRIEHMMVVGGSGAGKSQLLSTLISRDLFKPCSIVVFDSQGDLLENILRVNVPRERIVYIDPTDVDHPTALSFFDFNTSGDTNYEREKNFNSVVELLLFVLNSLDSSVTSKQELCLRMLIRFCLVIPDATIHTLRDLLTEKGFARYQEHLPKLTETARGFFADEYLSRPFNETREQISRRVYTILESPLERMFASSKSRIHMRQLLDEGTIILISTAKSFLKEQGSAFFARFMTALIFQAIQERNPQKDNLDVFMYIDEAAPVISTQVTTILETGRKYKLGLTLAFQSLSQIPADLQHSVISNTATKAVSGISAKDARALAMDMETEAEILMGTKRLLFALYAKSYFHNWYRVTPGLLKTLPQRTDLKTLIKENREKYARLPEKKQEVKKPDDPSKLIDDWHTP